MLVHCMVLGRRRLCTGTAPSKPYILFYAKIVCLRMHALQDERWSLTRLVQLTLHQLALAEFERQAGLGSCTPAARILGHVGPD